MRSKIILASIFFGSIFFMFPRNIKAAFMTVDQTGNIVWNVLGIEDSVFEVKKLVTTLNTLSNSEILIKRDGDKINIGENQISGEVSDLVEIEKRGQSREVKIFNKDGFFEIKTNDISAKTLFPILVDSKNSKIGITTNSGNRYLTLLPIEIFDNLIKAKIITSNKDEMSLIEDDQGQLKYLVDANKNVNFFNVYSADIPVKVSVSAIDGQVLEIDQPVWLRVLGFLFE